MKVNGKDDIPYMKWKIIRVMFETTNQTFMPTNHSEKDIGKGHSHSRGRTFSHAQTSGASGFHPPCGFDQWCNYKLATLCLRCWPVKRVVTDDILFWRFGLQANQHCGFVARFIADFVRCLKPLIDNKTWRSMFLISNADVFYDIRHRLPSWIHAKREEPVWKFWWYLMILATTCSIGIPVYPNVSCQMTLH